jgi:phospholipase C
MKSSLLLLLAAALVSTAAHAQYGSTPIKHVVVIFQENRTPDNLFQGLCTANGGVPGCSPSGAGGDIRHRIELREFGRPDRATAACWAGHQL